MSLVLFSLMMQLSFRSLVLMEQLVKREECRWYAQRSNELDALLRSSTIPYKVRAQWQTWRQRSVSCTK